MALFKVVETDNFGGDYPDEKFVNIPDLPEEKAKQVAEAINSYTGSHCNRYWKVVPSDYTLIGGFEP